MLVNARSSNESWSGSWSEMAFRTWFVPLWTRPMLAEETIVNLNFCFMYKTMNFLYSAGLCVSVKNVIGTFRCRRLLPTWPNSLRFYSLCYFSSTAMESNETRESSLSYHGKKQKSGFWISDFGVISINRKVVLWLIWYYVLFLWNIKYVLGRGVVVSHTLSFKEQL